MTADQQAAARAYQLGWKALFARFLGRVDVIALPTVPFFLPPLAEAEQHDFPQFTAPETWPWRASAGPARAQRAPAAGQHPADRPRQRRRAAARNRR